MIRYKEFGLVNTKEMYRKALEGGYAIAGYNFNTLEQLQAIILAGVETKSPVLLQYFMLPPIQLHLKILVHMVHGAVKMAEDLCADTGAKIPIVLHLDHGLNFDICKSCVDSGFSSVMIDGSHLSYEKNVALTKSVVQYAHQYDVTVEGELGTISGIKKDSSTDKDFYTKPEEAEDFVRKTGIDSLAIAIGTAHGAYKFQIKPGDALPSLRFDILEKIKGRLPQFPFVLHGASSIPKVPHDYVQMINQYGGTMKNAVGIPEDQIRKAISLHVCKLNIHSDSQITMTGTIRKHLAENPADFDPRTYLESARKALVEFYEYKNREVLGSAGHA
jgi:fructose-bisphosphate aldolase class II